MVKLNERTNDDSSENKGLENYDLWKKIRTCLLVKDRVLYPENKNGVDIVVVPKKMRTKVCTLHHDSITFGHLGFEKTNSSICSKFYWQRMKSDIFDHFSICQKQKVANNHQKAALVSIKVEKPWELVGIDVAGPLKPTKKGNKYFIIIVDYLSKNLIYRATADATSATTIRFAKEELVSKPGASYAMLSDQGRNFEAKAMDEFCHNTESRSNEQQVTTISVMG